MSKIKVGWLQQAIGIKGGAEMSCGLLVQHAPEWAEIVPCPHNIRPPEEVDVFVIQNSVPYNEQWIEELAFKPVVKQIRDPWYAGSAMLRRYLLDRAAALIFSSQTQVDSFGYEFDAPYHIIPVPIDLEPFREADRKAREEGVERQGSVAVGRVDIYKGAPRIVDWALRTGEPVTFIGKTMMPFGELPPFIRFVGNVPYERLPWAMARAERLVAMPEWPEAFGRAVVEAWAAGCALKIDGRVGAKEYIDNEPERLGLQGPIDEFWQIVESVL